MRHGRGRDEPDGAVLTITLNRPDVLNAFNKAMHDGLAAALKDARDPEVRAVVVTGAGRGFCVGQDLTEFREAPTTSPTVSRELSPERARRAGAREAGDRLGQRPAAGAGLSFAAACDLRIAADSATFVPAFINIGLIPDSGGTFFISRLLGPARAFEWMTSGRRLTAAEAQEWGLVSEVVEADRLAARTAELAASLAAMPTRAVGMTKRLFAAAPTNSLDEQLELEAQLQTAATQTEDFREGVTAFLEKRDPQFKGA